MHARDQEAEVVAKLVALRRIPCLAALAPAVLAGLAERATPRHVRAGEVLAYLPEAVRFVPPGVDVAGAATATRGIAATAPDLVPFLAGEREPHDVRVRGEGIALEVSHADFAAAFEDEFSLFLALARAVAAESIDGALLRAWPGVTDVGRHDGLPLADPGDLLDRLRVLRATLPFGRRRVAALVTIARHAAEVRANEGFELWREDDASDAILVVLRGVVGARLGARRVGAFGPGSVLGGAEALAGRPRWFSAVVEQPLVALSLSTERFLDVLEDEPELAREVLGELARQWLAAWNVTPLPSGRVT